MLVNSVRHQVATEVISKFPTLELDEVRVNHRQLLNAIWTWAGVKRNERLQIAQVGNSYSWRPLTSLRLFDVHIIVLPLYSLLCVSPDLVVSS